MQLHSMWGWKQRKEIEEGMHEPERLVPLLERVA